MKAIFKKELKSFFNNVTGFLFVGSILLVFGLYFFYYSITIGYPTISISLSSIRFFLVIMCPVLSMRLLSKERKDKTDQLLLTSGVSEEIIIFSKFLAAGAVYTFSVLIMAISPIFLSFFGDVSFAENYTALLGFYLYGLSFIAISFFASSLTENQMISAVLGIIFIFIGFMMSAIVDILPGSDNLFKKILSSYDLNSYLDDFLSGNLSINGIIYYITIIFIFISLSAFVLKRKRLSFKNRFLWSNLYSVFLTVFIIVCLIGANILLSYLPEKYKNIDVTERKMYLLSDETVEFLDGISSDVTISVVGEEKDIDDLLNKTLKRFSDENKHIKIKYVKDENNLLSGSLIVSGNDKTKEINYSDIYKTEVDYYTYTESVTGYDGEGAIASAISYVLSDEENTAYIISGHGEKSFSGNYHDVLKKSNIDYEYINLIDVEKIDKDVSFVIINGPESDFSEDDIKKIKDYLEDGGKLLLTLDCISTDETKNLSSFINSYGLSVVPGIIGEEDSDYYYPASKFYLLPMVNSWSVTNNLISYVFSPDTAGLKQLDETKDDIFITSILDTSDKARAYNIVPVSEGSDSLTASDEYSEEGTFSIGEAVSYGSDDADIYIFGSFEMFTDAADQIVSNTNRTLFTNIINEFKGEDEMSLNIPVKTYESSNIAFSAASVIGYGILWGIIIPVLLIIIGISVFIYRNVKK